MASKILVLLLALIAALVSAMQYINGRKRRSVMWACIVLYWIVLTVKNICDLMNQ